MNQACDPVTLAIVQKRLDNISLQMGWVMTRSARSPIFNQSHDFSCFVADGSGYIVSQADGLPIHTGGGGFALRAILAEFGTEIREGDLFLTNDPYEGGGTHLPDWVIARPVFWDGHLVAFTCNRAHQSDIGGGAPGGFNAAATEIFHEGVRFPPLRIAEKGVLRRDIRNMLLLNSRTPELLDGDLGAMIGSTEIGAHRVVDLARELGIDGFVRHLDAILDHADTCFRAIVSDLPDGTYDAVEITDTDCFELVDLPIRVRLTVAGERLSVDFGGTSPQMKGFKNSPIANTSSAVYMALSSFLSPDLPKNEGLFRSVEILAPAGTLVNPVAPAPVGMCTVSLAHEIIHVVWKALAAIVPDLGCAGWGKPIHGITSGRAGDAPFVMFHWHAMGGGGAIRGRDGFDQIGHLIALGGLTLPNVEGYEQVYPVHVKRQEFRIDAGGAGQFRGGSGVDYEIEVETAAFYAFRGEGLTTPSGFGVAGGEYGMPGEMLVSPRDEPAFAPPKYGNAQLGPLAMSASSPGGGGWGDPFARSPDCVARDVRNGFVSRTAAIEQYGVILTEAGTIDHVRTEDLRRARHDGGRQAP